MKRVEELAQPTLFRQALFVPPGYSSLLFAHLYESNSCPRPTWLFRGFRTWMHHRLGLQPLPGIKSSQASFEVFTTLTIILRLGTEVCKL